ncbi:MAG: M20/M25/M40 family metallo-hydrolase [Eubacteriaceae bacterium]|nr:M20/M25/M40 family metallo-hydrolase [Eubacteriaceae bacterium]
MVENIARQIKETLYSYVEAQSISNSYSEKSAEKFFLDYFGKQEYFQNHPEFYGAYPIVGDPFGRAAVWAMRKGSTEDTVVLIHHNDVVTVEDFKLLKDWAFSPDELEEKLFEIKDTLADEAREDLESGTYLFGRGVCDMKGGGAIQMVLLSEYCKMDDFKGNVIVLGVPDEENLSAGMRAGVTLLKELKEKYGLKYRLMINSEPHQRKTKEDGVFSFGSIGKIMPYVYVRGCLAHAGKVFEGLNPTNVMCEIVRRTEVNMELSDVVGSEAAPPPTWLYLRENKLSYDVSMPLTINGCLSVLTLNQSPAGLMDKLRKICNDAFESVICDMNRNYADFLEKTHQPVRRLPWEAKVVDFGELYREAEGNHGQIFTEAYNRKMEQLKEDLQTKDASLIMANFELVDFVYDYIDDLSPRVVIGLMPPYYPNVANVLAADEYDDVINNMYGWLTDYTKEKYNQNYIQENYYTGISDLSYSSIKNGKDIADSLEKMMPFFGDIYSLPLEDIEAVSMPCVNIGPWGKDFHKLTERVLKEDLYYRTPDILNYAIKRILEY